MNNTELNKKEIKNLLPHREPMLLIDKLTKIVGKNDQIINSHYNMRVNINCEKIKLHYKDFK